MSSSALTTVAKGLFKDEDYDLDAISSPKRRPDIICLKQYSLKAVCTDRIDPTAGEIMKPDQILIVEVKRGGFEITDDEVIKWNSMSDKFENLPYYIVLQLLMHM